MIKPTGQPQWRRARMCGSNACVEVAKIDDHYLIRDSKDPDRPALWFTSQEWEVFVAGVRDGDFNFA